MNERPPDHVRAWLLERATAPARAYPIRAGIAFLVVLLMRGEPVFEPSPGALGLLAAILICLTVPLLRTRLGGPASFVVAVASISAATVSTFVSASFSVALISLAAAIYASREAPEALAAAVELWRHGPSREARGRAGLRARSGGVDGTSPDRV